MESGSTRTDSPSAIGALGSSILSEGHVRLPPFSPRP